MDIIKSWPKSNEECLQAFEQAKSEGLALSEAQNTFYNNLTTQTNYTQSTKPAPPILGAGGVKNIHYPHKQITLKF